MSAGAPTIDALWKARPRSRFLRGSVALILGLFVVAWWRLGIDLSILWSESTTTFLSRFWAEDLCPAPLRGQPWEWGIFFDWLGDLMRTSGWVAASTTLAVSVVAIVLAALLGAGLALPAARTLATPEPYLPAGRRPEAAARLAWAAVRGLTRAVLILMRSVPEYLLAFLLLGILGHTAWPAVLALAIHNAGILGRLDAEVIENLPGAPLRALRAGGAGRLQTVAVGVFPAALPRFLLYFFYRWETCIREATVLGMLGLAGLGYFISEASAHYQEDRLVVFVLLGSVIVLLGDLLSAVARRFVRGA